MVALALPPSSVAGAKDESETPAGTAPSVAPLTTLSLSLAETLKLPPVPVSKEALAGQLVAMGAFTVPPMGVPATSMSSTPRHSSLPEALVVRMRTCTWAWLSTAAGSTTSTGVVCVAEPAVVASATKPAGTLMKLPELPMRYCSATACTALSAELSRSRSR